MSYMLSVVDSIISLTCVAVKFGLMEKINPASAEASGVDDDVPIPAVYPV